MVELVVLAPALFVFSLAALAFGLVSEARHQAVESARAGAQSAAVLPTASDADWAAHAAALLGAFDRRRSCARLTVGDDLSQFRPGGSVTVTVSCQADLSEVLLPGVPATATVHASVVAPVDPYRSVR